MLPKDFLACRDRLLAEVTVFPAAPAPPEGRPASRAESRWAETFDLDASKSRICPFADVKETHRGRIVQCGEAKLPPGGARLAIPHRQRYGCPLRTGRSLADASRSGGTSLGPRRRIVCRGRIPLAKHP